MIFKKFKYSILTLLAATVLMACNNDDMDMEPMAMATCSDGIMNGDEEGVDCGGSVCEPCADSTGPDFTGTFAQADHMGRPGINTTLSFDMDGMPSVKDAHNVTIPSEMTASFQAGFQARLEQYHDVYANKLGLDPMDVNYENNILGLDAATLTTVLAADALDVAPDAPTTYFDPGTDADNDGNILVPDGDEVALTGRALQDDIIDVSLILFFGGMNGDRFSGQDLDNDGMADLPRLTSDGVGLTATINSEFPYLSAPE
ncbi:hypothetical protein ACA086_11740 [Muriicola sp. E247]|uniref:hypothetical protein n=1 Tax=Muriicola sp. E247 TaxID=3242730 RepID=UPI00352472CF